MQLASLRFGYSRAALPSESRPSRAVDHLDGAGAVERVQAPTRPERTGGEGRHRLLLVAAIVETQDARQAEGGAVAGTAVLHRPPQGAVAPHHPAGRAGG